MKNRNVNVPPHLLLSRRGRGGKNGCGKGNFSQSARLVEVTMKTRKIVTRATLVLVVMIASFIPGQLFAQKIRVGYWTSGFSLGFGAVLEQMKFADKEGLNVEWVKFAEVNGPTRAIVSHGIDLAFAAPSTASMQIAG